MRPSVICFGVGTGFATVSNVGYGSRCGRAEKKGATDEVQTDEVQSEQ